MFVALVLLPDDDREHVHSSSDRRENDKLDTVGKALYRYRGDGCDQIDPESDPETDQPVRAPKKSLWDDVEEEESKF